MSIEVISLQLPEKKTEGEKTTEKGISLGK